MLVLDARSTHYFLYPRRQLADYSLLRLLFFLLFRGRLPRRGNQVQILQGCKHERWEEVRVFSVAGAILGVETI